MHIYSLLSQFLQIELILGAMTFVRYATCYFCALRNIKWWFATKNFKYILQKQWFLIKIEAFD